MKSGAHNETKKKRGGVVNFQENTFPEQQGFGAPVQQEPARALPQGFTTEDILWALGIWSVILGLSPVIVFYVLMVA